ncbi:integrin beta-6-like [Amphiura filiformis]|uniref:integrin beta-6-like n=1 Tax=Amphiura filiformis TaxID=82378 RepID=UPI003B218557
MSHIAVLWALIVLYFVPALYNCQEIPSEDICAGAMRCGDCILHDPSCRWCSDAYESFSGIRCGSRSNLLIRGCDNIVSHNGNVKIIKEPELTDNDNSPNGQAFQVTPQEARVRLKVGQPQVITLKVRLANNYPLDVYLLMDLSASMRHDLRNLVRLGADIGK